MEERLFHALSQLAKDASDFGNTVYYTFNRKPTQIEFSQCVGRNRPAVFRQAFTDSKAVQKWRQCVYLKEKMGENLVTVSMTPNGLADSVMDGNFILPYETKLNLSNLFNNLGIENKNCVHYVQSQNDNLKNEWSPLFEDLPIIDFADILGEPDASNIWVGDDKSTTSLHKDHYENIYIVITGTKTFKLLPPTDFGLLDETTYNIKKWNFDDVNQTWNLLEQDGSTPWVIIPDSSMDLVHPIEITLLAGDGLYLPSLWFHQVKQQHEQLDGMNACIAVNFWFDMDYSDSRFSYFQLLKNLHKLSKEQ